MDLAALIIGVFLFALFIGPLVYATSTRNRKNKQLLKDFSDLATKHSISITTSDLWSNFYVIGIDPVAAKVLYLKKYQDTKQEVLIDLARVAKCRIGKQCKSSKNQKETIIYRLELIFTFYDPAIPERSVEFYNGGETMYLNGELPLIEKWQDIININLKGKPKQAKKPVLA